MKSEQWREKPAKWESFRILVTLRQILSDVSAVIMVNEADILTGLKPPNAFQLLSQESVYEPNFVVETKKHFFYEPKRADQMQKIMLLLKRRRQWSTVQACDRA